MLSDMFFLIPFQFLKSKEGIEDLLWAVKLPRILSVIEFLNVGQARRYLKELYINYILDSNKEKFKEMTNKEIKDIDYVK
jgi:hypothetical protein